MNGRSEVVHMERVSGEGATTTAPLLEVRALKKSFALKPILRGIDLVLCPGQSMALLGANGVGKTTLMRILAGLAHPSSGSVTIAGLDSVYDALLVSRLVGFVAHQPYLYEELTAQENLLFFARMYTVEQPQERIQMLLVRVGLERRSAERVGTFSRGQLQRLAWARALLHSPRLLLLDEPDTGLDQEGQALVDELLGEHIARGGSALFTTHQHERTLALSDCLVILSGGRVAYQGVTSALDLSSLRHLYREVTA